MINCHHCQQKDEDIRKMNETKEIILSANQTLTDHIKKQNEEIENLKYKNNYLAECALEEQKKLKDELKKLLSLHCERCEDPAECPRCGWHLVTKELIK